MKKSRPSILAQSIAAALALAILSPGARGGQIWDGGGTDGLWTNPLNWDGDTVPNYANPLQFDGLLQLLSNNDATGVVAGLSFNAGAGAFTLSNMAITLDGGIVNLSANTQRVSFNSIGLGSSQVFNASTADLTVTAPVNVGVNTLTIDGARNTTLGGSLSGGGGIIKTGAGALTVTQLNTFGGGVTLANGTLFADNNTALGPGTLTITSTGGPTTLGSHTDGTALSNAISVQSDFSVSAPAGGAHNFLLAGPVDLNGATRTITGLTNQGQVHFSGVVSNGGLTLNTSGLPAGPAGSSSYVAFIFDGLVAPTYTGLTTVDTGAFLVFQSMPQKILGNVLIQGNGVVDYLGFSNQIADTATVTVNSSGSTILNGTKFAGLELFNNNDTIGTLFGTGTVGLGDGTLTVGAGNFSGVIGNGERGAVGGTGGRLTKNTAGTLILTGANTYTSNTLISAGTLQIGDGGATGSLASPTINNIVGGTLVFNRSGALTVGSVISGGMTVRHIGPGITTLTGASTYTGVTTLGAGIINLGAAEIVGVSGPLGKPTVLANSIVLSGGTLQYSAVNQNDYSARFSTAANQAYNVDTNGQNVTFATALTSAGGTLTKSGAGTLRLTAAETYTGATTVNGGTLNLDFSAAGAPATNILNNAANSSTLVLGGGTLLLTGKTNTADSQIVNGLVLNAGASAIRLTAATANPLLLTLGAITNNPGSTVDFTLPTGVQSATNGITTTRLNTNGILGVFATVGGNDFAVNATNTPGGNIVGLASINGYTLTSVALNNPANYQNANISVDSSQTPTGPINPNTLRFDTPIPTTLTLTGVNVITTGAIIVTSNVGNNLSTITGGTLEGSQGGDLAITQNNTAGGFTIGSIIANNGGATGLIKNGAGTLTLTAANTYTGGTDINGGRLAITTTGQLGTGGINFQNNGELLVNGATFSSAEAVTISPGATGRLSNSNAASPTVFTGLFTLGAGSTLAIGSAGNTGVVVLTPGVPAVIDPAALVSVDFGTLRNGSASGFQAITAVAASTTVGAGATLDANGFATTINNLQGAGTLTNSAAAPVTFTINSGLFSGSINNGASTVSLTKTTNGVLTLAGPNSYTGQTTISAGTLRAGATNAFAPASNFVITSTLDLGGFSNTIGGLAGTSDAIVQNTGPTAATLTTGGNNGDSGFLGLIRDNGSALSITKVGTGRQSFTGNNSYTGDTFLQQGSLFSDVTPGAAGNRAFGTGALIIAGGTRLGSTVDSEVIPNDIRVAGDFTIEANTRLALGGDVDLTGGVRTFTGVTNRSEIAFSGVISNGGVTLSTAGLPAPMGGANSYVAFLYSGQLSNTYTGLTTVNDGAFLVFVTDGPQVAGDVLIQGNGVVDYLSGSDQISDTSRVTVNSRGSVIAGNNNSTTAFAGLELFNKTDTIGSLFGTGTVGLGSGLLRVGAGDFSGVIGDGAMGNGGELTKNTTGTLRLSGANTFTGNTNINNGTLVLDGSVQSPSIFVNFSGTLMGSGTAFRNVINAGVFSPGNSPGTFHIGGDYVQTGAGTMVVEIGGTKASDHDLTVVSGRAVLDGGLRLVKLGSARLKIGDKVTFLTAGGGVTGVFSRTENPFNTGSILTTKVLYESNAVSLVAEQGSFEQFADEQRLTDNQRRVASLLDRVSGSKSQRKLIDFLNTETLNALPRDFDRIAPDELQSIFTIGAAQANVQTANLQRRLDGIRAGNSGFSAEGLAVTGPAPEEPTPPPATPAADIPDPSPVYVPPNPNGAQGPEGAGGRELRAPADRRYGAFITGVGEFAQLNGTANASGYDLSTGGFTLGADYRLNDHFAIGINAGYARSTADLTNGGEVTVDAASFGVYATYFNEGFYADAAIQGSFTSYDTRRSALQGSATGSTSGGTVNTLIATGFDFTSDALKIGPTASFQYTNISFDRFRETGSLAPLNYDSQSSSSMRTAVGMRAAYEWRYQGVIVKPEVRAAWQHEFGDAAYAIDSSLANGGPKFTIQGAEIGRDSLLLGLGVAVLWNERTATYLYYDGEIGRSDYNASNVSGGVRMAF